MPDLKIADLIRTSRGEADTQSYLQFSADRNLIDKVGKVGVEILRNVDVVPGACAAMSALYTCLLQDRFPGAIFHMAAGSLLIHSQRIFGTHAPHSDWTETFAASNNDWDGHCWIVCDDYVADVSVFRTAYSPKAPPLLARTVRAAFGEGRGLMIAQDTTPLCYQAEYILTDDQVTALGRGAVQLFSRSRP